MLKSKEDFVRLLIKFVMFDRRVKLFFYFYKQTSIEISTIDAMLIRFKVCTVRS